MARRRVWRPKSRAGGCLMWIILLILLLIVLSVLFGGFQKGTKVNGLGVRPVVTVTGFEQSAHGNTHGYGAAG
jgi:hypothetical protein